MNSSIEVLIFIVIITIAALLTGQWVQYIPPKPVSDTHIVSQKIVTPTVSPQAFNGLELGTFKVDTVTVIPSPPLPSVPPGSILTHGAFNIYTPMEVQQAHNVGVEYDIPDYWGNAGPTALTWDVDVNSALGKALLANHMKGFLMLSDLISRGKGTSMLFDEKTFINRVNQYKNSPLLGGYWIKDDDPYWCGDGFPSDPLVSILQKEYADIRRLDQQTNHIIMAGFCTHNDLNKNYHPTITQPIADAIGMYPYPNLYGSQFNFNEVTEISEEVASIKNTTAQGNKMPIMVGIYEGFWGDNCYLGIYHCNGGVAPISQTELHKDMAAFMGSGFSGLVDFAFEAADVNHTAGNDTGMLQYAQEATSYLQSIGKYP